MRIKLIAATIAGALTCATLGAAIATASSGTPDKARVAAPERGTVGASAPNARAAALVEDNGTFVRQKGFLKINHTLASGQYCLKLQSTINENTLIASVTPEYVHSPDGNVTADWYASHADCPVKGNWVEVLTFSDPGGAAWFQQDEAFSIVIP